MSGTIPNPGGPVNPAVVPGRASAGPTAINGLGNPAASVSADYILARLLALAILNTNGKSQMSTIPPPATLPHA
jgi:hypothetical protein